MALLFLKIMVMKYDSTVTMQVGAFEKQNKRIKFNYIQHVSLMVVC